MRHLHIADFLHALLAALLFLQEFSFTTDITAIAFGRHVLAHLFHGFACDDFGPDGCLYGDIKLLTRQQFLEFLTHSPSEIHGVVYMREGGEGIDRLSVEQDVEFDQF